MNRAEILEHLQPAIDELVARITALVPELVRAQLMDAIGKLTGTPAHTAPEQAPKRRKIAQRDTKPAKVIKASGRKPNSCKKCGAVGFTSSTCGKTHNLGDSLPEALDRQMDVRPDRKPPPHPASAPIASLRSRRPPKRAEATDSPDADSDVPLHKVVAFTF
jgi:hypothetical protein